MTRTFTLLALAFALLGCGKQPDPAPSPGPAPVPPGGTTPSTAPVVQEVVHELDAAKHVVPNQPVGGRVAGKTFTPDQVELDGSLLTFRQGPANSPDVLLRVALRSAPPADQDFHLVVKADQKAAAGIPDVSVNVKDGAALKTIAVPEGYALTLDVGKPENGIAKGKVHLSLPGPAKDVIAGTFTALHDRSPLDPPTAADRPYLTGAITHAAAKDATLMVGYVRLPAAGAESIYDTVQTTVQDGPIGAVRSSAHKPQSVTIRPAGEGKEVAFDVTKLPPGKYLVAARVEGGIPAWAVRDVAAGADLTVPLALPADGAGTVEVALPADAPADPNAQVQVLPAELALDATTDQFEAYAGLVLGTWVELKGGAATVKQLPPGEYVASARVGGTRYAAKVTVKKGKTAKAALVAVP